MSDKKTKVECRLVTRGTQAANTKAIDDLAIPDPDSAVGKQIIEDEMGEETKDDSK